MPFTAQVRHDETARVWYVHDSDLPGLHAEAAALDELVTIIEDVVPDLAADLLDAGAAPRGTAVELAISIQHLVVTKRPRAA